MSDAPTDDDENVDEPDLEDLTPEGESAEDVTGGATARTLK